MVEVGASSAGVEVAPAPAHAHEELTTFEEGGSGHGRIDTDTGVEHKSFTPWGVWLLRTHMERRPEGGSFTPVAS